ncbi:MAG: hypothetical protein RO257_07300 [Candidatus Kapabacteria bacterium]|nr:hypothetical protein [Candidatus Kapabacteria bacterium]
MNLKSKWLQYVIYFIVFTIVVTIVKVFIFGDEFKEIGYDVLMGGIISTVVFFLIISYNNKRLLKNKRQK